MAFPISSRTFSNEHFPATGAFRRVKFSLRPYQEAAVAAGIETDEPTLIVSPTGTGKTVIGAAITEHDVMCGARVLILAHKKELIGQFSAKLDEFGLKDHGTIKRGHWRFYPKRPIQVASIQTLVNRLDKVPMDFDRVIIDEAHRTPAATYVKIMQAITKPYRLTGLTATPYRMSKKSGLGDHFSSLIEAISIPDAVGQGYLVTPRVFAKPVDLSGVRMTRGDYDEAEMAAALNKKVLNGNVVDQWCKHASVRQTIVFASSVQHSRDLCEAFNARGIPAAHLDGETPDAARGHMLEDLATGSIRVLCNRDVLTEGYDCPVVSCIVLARGTKSRGLWRQMIGRGQRLHPDKTDYIILDHGDCTREHGFPTDPDTITLARGVEPSKASPRFNCPHCKEPLRGWPAVCPYCQTPIDRKLVPTEVLEIETELVEIQPQAERAKAYKDLNNEAYLKKYSPQWANVQFHRKFGRFPTKAEIAAAVYPFVHHGGKCVWQSEVDRQPKPVTVQDILDRQFG